MQGFLGLFNTKLPEKPRPPSTKNKQHRRTPNRNSVETLVTTQAQYSQPKPNTENPEIKPQSSQKNPNTENPKKPKTEQGTTELSVRPLVRPFKLVPLGSAFMAQRNLIILRTWAGRNLRGPAKSDELLVVFLGHPHDKWLTLTGEQQKISFSSSVVEFQPLNYNKQKCEKTCFPTTSMMSWPKVTVLTSLGKMQSAGGWGVMDTSSFGSSQP